MQMQMFAIFDKASASFSRPFFELTKGLAIRTFTDAVNDANSPFGKYPQDFTLFYLGVFDDQSGELVGSSPDRVILASEVVRQSD